jgi:FkbM family methyltransferase
MTRTILKSILGYGKLRGQSIFSKMHLFALHGMNFDIGPCGATGEIQALQYVKAQLARSKKPIVVFDIGANVGEYTLSVLGCFGSDALIHAFEPSTQAFDALKAAVAGMGTVKLHNIGFGDEEGTLDLFYDHPGSSTASVYQQRPDHACPTRFHETVQIKTVDDFCREENIERIGFLKIDVEGHEMKVLQGARKLLESDRIDFIQFEFGYRNVDSRTYFRDFFCLLDEKYKLYRIITDGLFPIDHYSEQYEVFTGPVNYLAEHR